jgi:hypothetical protein
VECDDGGAFVSFFHTRLDLGLPRGFDISIAGVVSLLERFANEPVEVACWAAAAIFEDFRFAAVDLEIVAQNPVQDHRRTS